MSSASLNINVVEKRMFKESEAANYSGLPAKYFKTVCPVHAVWSRIDVQRMKAVQLSYAKRKLVDIDAFKNDTDLATFNDIIGKLE